MKFEEWLSQQDGVIEVDCGCVTTEAFYHWLRVAYEAGTLTNEDTRQVDELTMWVKRLVRSLKKASPDSKLHSEAMDYLTAKGLISVGDALR